MTFSKCYSIAKFRVFSAAIIGVVFGLSGWVVSTGVVMAQDYEGQKPLKLVVNPVKLDFPVDKGKNFKVDKDNQCRKNKHRGCLLFKKGEEGHINFYLPGSKNQAKYCPNAEYVITSIEVTATGADEGRSVYKGDFDAKVPSWLRDAFPTIDPETGIIFEASVDVARTREWVTNLNNHVNPLDGPDIVNSFWYKVTVTACDGSATWVSDPRGDNEGSG